MKRPQIISSKVLNRLRPWLAVSVVLLCLSGMWGAGRAGLSRLFSSKGKSVGSLELSDRAVKLSPSDPEAHFARAWTLPAGEGVEVVAELERATALRPRDFSLWIELGEERERLGDKQGAFAAFSESARRAPYYAYPRWYLGKLYLRSGQREAAFAELRRAYVSDPTLLPAVIDFAWRTYEGDAHAVRDAIRPRTSAARFALESFFMEHGETTEAIKMFLELSHPPDWERREILSRLLAAKRFTESYQVWLKGREASVGTASNGIATITDGDFEGKIALDEPGFGWQFPGNIPTVSVLLDPSEPHSGAQSLRLEYRGDSDPTVPGVSELVLVEPRTRYRLSFAARTKDVVTGGSPLVAVTDASDERVLAQSTSLPQGTGGWRDYVLDFATPEKTSAVLIQIRRQGCDDVPCPIFGYVWIDTFTLQKS